MERTVKMKRSDLAMAHNNLVKVISDIATSGEEKELTNEERLSVIKNLLILRILKLGILPEITPLWAFGNDFSSFQAVC